MQLNVEVIDHPKYEHFYASSAGLCRCNGASLLYLGQSIANTVAVFATTPGARYPVRLG